MATRYEPKGRLGRAVHGFEETAIAVLLGGMTMLTFVNVVLRYLFNQSIIWSLEVILVLFAWLVMFGVSYVFKIGANLGVDALTNVLPDRGRRISALLAAAVTLAYALLLMKGAWDFWANYGNLPQTTGRWFPTGLQDMRPQDYRGYTPTQSVPMIGFLSGPLESWLLIEGDAPFEKFPRAIPFLIMPLAAALILLRVVQAVVAVWTGERASMIVSHEAEDAVEEASATLRASDAAASVTATYTPTHDPAARRT